MIVPFLDAEKDRDTRISQTLEAPPQLNKVRSVISGVTPLGFSNLI